jgi:hypothetical protein
LSAPSTEKGYVKYAWVIVVVAGLIDLVTALYLVVFPSPLDNPGVVSLTGVSWQTIQTQSPSAAKLTSYFVGQFGIQETFLALLTIGLAVTGMRSGQRWAWYLLWIPPIAFLAYAATNFSIGGTTWTLAAVDALIAFVGLLLPIRKFTSKTERPVRMLTI